MSNIDDFWKKTEANCRKHTCVNISKEAFRDYIIGYLISYLDYEGVECSITNDTFYKMIDKIVDSKTALSSFNKAINAAFNESWSCYGDSLFLFDNIQLLFNKRSEGKKLIILLNSEASKLKDEQSYEKEKADAIRKFNLVEKK